MKKILRILLIVLGVILLLLITLPILFKSKIEAVVKEKVNQEVSATVDWSRFNLNFFRGFPDLSINLHQVSVVGKGVFEGDTLAALNRFELRANPFSAFRKKIEVKTILIDRPLVNGIVMEDGTANWDITSPTSEQDTVTAKNNGQVAESGQEAASPGTGSQIQAGQQEDIENSMAIQLQRFAITGGRIYYDDREQQLKSSLEGFDLELRGDFAQDRTDLDLAMKIGRINARMGGVRYMHNGTFKAEMKAAADMVNQTYTLERNEMNLNGLVLGAEGSVKLLDDGAMDMDLRYYSKETTFKTLLSLVPAIYLEGFETLKSSGSLKLEGMLSGIMKDTLLPDATLELQVKDGYFAYPGLPKDVSDVQIILAVNYNGTAMDETTVALERFHLSLGGNPFDLEMHLDHPVSDPHVSGRALGSIDFSTLHEVIPLEDVSLAGSMETDLSWDTRISFIEKEQYEKVNLAGELIIRGVQLEAPDIPVPVELSELNMEFTPRLVNLSALDLKMGSSDLHLRGTLSNFIPYVFDDQVVSGELMVASDLLDVNELMPQASPVQESGPDTTSEKEILEPAPPDSVAVPSQVRIPGNIDFSMDLDMKSVHYNTISVDNIQGKMEVKEGIAYLDQLHMDVIEGQVEATGQVDTRGEYAMADLALDIAGVDIPSAYETFVTVKRLAPMARYCKGSANVKMQYASQLDASFAPLYESIDAKGRVFTRGLQIYNLNSFVRLSEMLKNEKFRQMAPDEVDLAITVREGRIIVDPFDIHFDRSKITVSGSHGIDLTMDYLLDMEIAKSDLGEGVNDLMSGVAALATGAGFKVKQSDFVNVKATVKGTFNDPEVTTDLRGNFQTAGESVVKAVEKRVTEEVEKVESQVKEEAGKKAEKILNDAEEEADRLVEEARKAGDALVEESKVQGDKLIREAGNNPIKQVAARRTAEELTKQAEKRSENLVKEAQEKADQVLLKAREEAEKATED